CARSRPNYDEFAYW
nr:immunoglobulin heavy chain junction region [Mus musculus]NSM04362.1 immunoglobulin heavy chain junction region [Mus musculus]NSM05532.1 immunoglobulin heavy chain junction region [Mus musculus]NSM07762.1 immunoglobulin heavy chain junction region [Mus musculus]NSM08239.1 immunoglobulin heavy chain junction region [Mus musculus]